MKSLSFQDLSQKAPLTLLNKFTLSVGTSYYTVPHCWELFTSRAYTVNNVWALVICVVIWYNMFLTDWPTMDWLTGWLHVTVWCIDWENVWWIDSDWPSLCLTVWLTLFDWLTDSLYDNRVWVIIIIAFNDCLTESVSLSVWLVYPLVLNSKCSLATWYCVGVGWPLGC